MTIGNGALVPSFVRTANLPPIEPMPKHGLGGPAPLRNRALHARERVAPSSENLDVELSDLLHAVRQGCRASFARLYTLTSGRLFGIVISINKDRADAEEVLQEVYIKVWNRCAQFDARKGQAMYWLRGIAHYSAIDNLRRRDARPHGSFTPAAAEGDPYAGLPSADLLPLDLVIRARSGDAVRRCLCKLSTEQREILTLAFYNGLSHVEIALQVQRPLGTVKSLLRRSLALMRPALAGHL